MWEWAPGSEPERREECELRVFLMPQLLLMVGRWEGWTGLAGAR